MTFVSHREEILGEVDRAVWASMDDVLHDAQRRSGSNELARSGSVQRIGPLMGRVIFRAPFARARERGAYIRPRQRRALKFANGDFAMHARLRKHPYLVPSARRWGSHLMARLREVGR